MSKTHLPPCDGKWAGIAHRVGAKLGFGNFRGGGILCVDEYYISFFV